jgi:hypothetical protein
MHQHNLCAMTRSSNGSTKATHASADDTDIGIMVLICSDSMHCNPSYWDNFIIICADAQYFSNKKCRYCRCRQQRRLSV